MRTVFVDLIPVMLTTSDIDIDLVEAEETLSLPDVTAGPEEEYDREGEVCLEELLGRSVLVAEGWDDGGDELGDEGDNDESQADP